MNPLPDFGDGDDSVDSFFFFLIIIIIITIIIIIIIIEFLTSQL